MRVSMSVYTVEYINRVKNFLKHRRQFFHKTQNQNMEKTTKAFFPHSVPLTKQANYVDR